MKTLYYSNYIERLTDGKKAAFYHTLNGNFIIFSDLNAFNRIDEIVMQHKKKLEDYEYILEKLIKQGFLLKRDITKEEEWKIYEEYYITFNKTIFCSWIHDELELAIPSSKKIHKIKLNKAEGEIWLKLNKNNIKFKELEKECSRLIHLSNYKNSLFKLSSEVKINKNTNDMFSNLYLHNFNTMDILKEDSEIQQINSNKNYPNSIYLKLTDSCNLNCKMCGQANSKRLGLIKNENTLDFYKIEKFLEPIMSELEYINLWGGEPLLHPMFEEFIKYFIKNKKYISIATNGILLKKYAKTIVELGVDEIVVSLDGPSKIHNNIRGTSNAFQATKSGIEEIIKLKKHIQIKPKIVLNCTISEENIDYLEEFLLLCREWNINKLIYQLPMFITEEQGKNHTAICEQLFGIRPISWMGFSKTYNLDIDKLYDFYTNVKNNYKSFADFYNISFRSKNELTEYFNKPNSCLGKSKCIILNSALVIESNGDLATCPDFPDIKYKNINSTDYHEFWQSKIRKEFIYHFNKNNGYPICKRCCQFI